jgi:hypothetical protein
MYRMTRIRVLAAAVLCLLPAGTNAQNFAAAGTRAAGMGGAFVGVADDATAIYWNPAALAAGSFFSLVIDSGNAQATPADLAAGTDGSSFIIGLTTPALGLGYYRLQARHATVPFALVPGNAAGAPVRIDSLTTHHAGITLVQSLTQGVAVGTTLKLVRGIAASQVLPASSPAAALDDDAANVLGRASNRFDLDVGIVAYGGPLKVGLTIRNVREPGFISAGDDPTELVLERQVRAGLSYALSRSWLAAADVDLLETSGALGPRRDAAFGIEGQVSDRLMVRSGVSVNTAGGADAFGDIGSSPAASVGGSYAARAAVFIDAHFTRGGDRAGHAWGVAARFVY